MFPLMFSLHISDFQTLIRFKIFQEDIIAYCLLLLFFYLSYFYLLPELLFKRKITIFVLSILICFFITVFTPKIITELINISNISFIRRPPDDFHRGRPAIRPEPKFLFMYGRFIIVFLIVFFFAYIIKINQKIKKIEKEKLGAELSFLKAQINPHFLFNTLNSIYSLSLEKSDDTPDAIVRLSGLLRYVITDTSQDFVTLAKEIAYIKDYIDLQKLRLGTTVTLDFQAPDETNSLVIAPMLLLPVIENTFKYGVSSEKDSTIEIIISVLENTLTLTTKNKKNAILQQQNSQERIGLQNTIMRLEHIYPGKYEIKIDENDTDYFFKLQIDL